MPYFLMGALIVWLLVLASLLLRVDFDPVTKLTWVIVVIFVPVFGILLYWFLDPKASAASDHEKMKTL